MKIDNQGVSSDRLEEMLRQVGVERYHDKHPFHLAMNAGELTKAQLQAWALNRYCYQFIIPQKDAVILSRSDDPEFRREWRKRIIDHDGDDGDVGGIARWLKLAEGLDLDLELVKSRTQALAATRYAVQAYMDLVSHSSLLVAVASSLTEMFSGAAIGVRVPAMLEHYDCITEDTLAYFAPRLHQAPRDANFAVAYVKEHARTPEQQQQVIDALVTKCDILWLMLDGLHHAYREPGHIPPGAFRPGEQ